MSEETAEELKERLIALETQVEEIIAENSDPESIFEGTLNVVESPAGSRQTIIHFVDVGDYGLSPPTSRGLGHACFQKIIDDEWDPNKRKRDRLISHGDLIVIKGSPCLYYCYVGLIDRTSDSPSGFQKEANIDGTIKNKRESGETRLELIVWTETFPGTGVVVKAEFSKTTLSPGSQQDINLDDLTITPDDPQPEEVDLKLPEIEVKDTTPDPAPEPIDVELPTKVEFKPSETDAHLDPPCTFYSQKITGDKVPNGEDIELDMFSLSSTTPTQGDKVVFHAFKLEVKKTNTKPKATLQATKLDIDQDFLDPTKSTKSKSATAKPQTFKVSEVDVKRTPLTAVDFSTASPSVTPGTWGEVTNYDSTDWNIHENVSQGELDCAYGSFETNRTTIDDSGTETPTNVYSNELTITNETPNGNPSTETIEMFDATHSWTGPETTNDYYFGAPTSNGSTAQARSYPAWAPNTQYTKGQVVTHGGKTWKVTDDHLSDPAGQEVPGVDVNWEERTDDLEKFNFTTDLDINIDCEDVTWDYDNDINVSEITELSFNAPSPSQKDNFDVITNVTAGTPTNVNKGVKSTNKFTEVTALNPILGTKQKLEEHTVLKSLENAYVDKGTKAKDDEFNILTGLGVNENLGKDFDTLALTSSAASSTDDCFAFDVKKIVVNERRQYFNERSATTYTQNWDFYVKGTPVKITTYEQKDNLTLANITKEIKVTEYENNNALNASISNINITEVAVDLKMKAVTHRIQNTIKKFSYDATWQQIPATIYNTTFDFDKHKLTITRRPGEWVGTKKTATFSSYIYKFAQTKRTDVIKAKSVTVSTDEETTVTSEPWKVYFECLKRERLYWREKDTTVSFDNPKTVTLTPYKSDLSYQNKEVTLTPRETELKYQNKELEISSEDYEFNFSNVYELTLENKTTTLTHDNPKWAKFKPSKITIKFEDEKEVTLTPKQYKFIMERKALKLTSKQLEIVYKEAKQYKAIPKNFTFKQFKKLIKYKPVTVTNTEGSLDLNTSECQTLNGTGGMGPTTTENMGSITVEPGSEPEEKISSTEFKEIPISPPPEPKTYPVDSLKIEEPTEQPEDIDEDIDSLKVECEEVDEYYKQEDIEFDAYELTTGDKSPIPDIDIDSTSVGTKSTTINDAESTKIDWDISNIDPKEETKYIRELGFYIKDTDPNKVTKSIKECEVAKTDDSDVPDAEILSTRVGKNPLTKPTDFNVEGTKICITETVDNSGNTVPDDSATIHSAEYVKGTDNPQPDKTIDSTSVSVTTDNSHTVPADKFETTITPQSTNYDPMEMTSITFDEVEPYYVSEICYFSRVDLNKNYGTSYDESASFNVNEITRTPGSPNAITWKGALYDKVDISSVNSPTLKFDRYKYTIDATDQSLQASEKARLTTEEIELGEEQSTSSYFDYPELLLENSNITKKAYVPILDKAPLSDTLKVINPAAYANGSALLNPEGVDCVNNQVFIKFSFLVDQYTVKCGVLTKKSDSTQKVYGHLKGPEVGDEVYQQEVSVCVYVGGGQYETKTINVLTTSVPDGQTNEDSVGRLMKGLPCGTPS